MLVSEPARYECVELADCGESDARDMMAQILYINTA